VQPQNKIYAVQNSLGKRPPFNFVSVALLGIVNAIFYRNPLAAAKPLEFAWQIEQQMLRREQRTVKNPCRTRCDTPLYPPR